MFIGKVQVPDKWSKLADLIQTQIPGQSTFGFQAGSTYSLQVESGTVRVCNSNNVPTGLDGEHLSENQFGLYEPDAGILQVRAKPKTGVVLLSVSEL